MGKGRIADGGIGTNNFHHFDYLLKYVVTLYDFRNNWIADFFVILFKEPAPLFKSV